MGLSEGDKLRIGSIVSRKDAVLSVLRAAIADGRLAPGERLEPDRIAAELGCSRMPVREALKILEKEGFVTCYPFRGTEVSQLRAADVEELFAIRMALEDLALTRALPVLTAADFAQMREILARMDDPTERPRWRELNHRFHAIINAACGWPRLIGQIDVLRQNVDRYVRIWVDTEGYATPQRQHWDLLRACEARDLAKARTVLQAHLRGTAERVAAVAAEASAAAQPTPVLTVSAPHHP